MSFLGYNQLFENYLIVGVFAFFAGGCLKRIGGVSLST